MNSQAAEVALLTRAHDRGRWWLTVFGPKRPRGEEPIARIAVELVEDDADFISRYADYRNALARVDGKELRRQWTRKSMSESMLTEAVERLRQQLKELTDLVGPLPTAGDDTKTQAEQDRYARRAIVEGSKKTSKQDK